MQYYGQAETAAKNILEAFKDGQIPDALAQIFIHRKDNVPCRSWSWSNQILAVLFGNGDARGFRQWESAGRYIKKGEHAFFILVPCIKKVVKDGKEDSILIGFKSAPVFGVQQTDGKLLEKDNTVDAFLDSLPCIEVARKWGLNVECFNAHQGSYLGYYKHNRAIAIGVENLHIWAHELMHAADHRLGNLTEHGQHWRSETVADFGATVLLEMLGFERQADRGFCWKYVSDYCQRENKQPVQACMSVLKRICDAINLILTEAETLTVKTEVAA